MSIDVFLSPDLLVMIKILAYLLYFAYLFHNYEQADVGVIISSDSSSIGKWQFDIYIYIIILYSISHNLDIKNKQQKKSFFNGLTPITKADLLLVRQYRLYSVIKSEERL